MPGPTLPLHVESGDARQYEQTAADFGLAPRRTHRDVPRFTEADKIAHAMLVAVVIAFALGWWIGRSGYPL